MLALRAILLAAMVVATSSVNAASWVQVTTTKGEVYHLDIDSVANIAPYTKAWFKTTYQSAQPVAAEPDKRYSAEKVLWYLDCRGKRAAVMAVVKLDEAGAVQSTANKPFDPNLLVDVVPESVGEAMHTAACLVASTRA